MSKPGRNDPCTCGSGEKYKKCCGKNNVIAFDPSFYNKELKQLNDNFAEYAMNYFHAEISMHVEEYVEIYLNASDEKTKNNYRNGLAPWIVLYEHMNNNRTVFESFYADKKYKNKHPSVRRAMSSWPKAVMGIFKVVTVEDAPISSITIEDMFTSETYKCLPYDLTRDNIGDFMIGILIPYINIHDFLFGMIKVPRDHSEYIQDILDRNIFDDEKTEDIYPDLLAEIIDPYGDFDLEWFDVEHEHVATLFKEHMIAKGFEATLITAGILLWNEYCNDNYPIIKKREGHAAAIEYIVQQYFLEDGIPTQSQLAKEYGTSAGTISTNYRKLDDYLEHVLSRPSDLNNGILAEIFTGDNLSNLPSEEKTFSMEQEMRNIQKIMENESFETDEEAVDFLNNLLKDGELPVAPMDPRDTAQDLLYQASGEHGRKKQQLITKALNIYPNSPDAYLLLAEDERDFSEYQRLLEHAITIGEQDLGKEFFVENKGHFWGLIETRPYMRAKAAYATSLEDAGFADEAVKHYEELLSLNPNDNQGIRDRLLPLYIVMEEFDQADKLLSNYENDVRASILFNKALVAFLTGGVTGKSLALLKEACDRNKYVLDYLMQKKEIPHTNFQSIQLGGETEAIAYAQDSVHLWADADEFIKAYLKKL